MCARTRSIRSRLSVFWPRAKDVARERSPAPVLGKMIEHAHPSQQPLDGRLLEQVGVLMTNRRSTAARRTARLASRQRQQVVHFTKFNEAGSHSLGPLQIEPQHQRHVRLADAHGFTRRPGMRKIRSQQDEVAIVVLGDVVADETQVRGSSASTSARTQDDGAIGMEFRPSRRRFNMLQEASGGL